MPKNMDSIKEPARWIPVYKRVGVVVCGSGSAGLAAAVCAARNGADVLLVERNSYLGGESTAAYQNWFGGPTDILTGFAKEYAEKLDDRGAARLLERYRKQTAATGIQPLSYHISIEPEEWKYLASDMVEEAGAKVITNTWAVDAIVENQHIKGVIIENKSGRQAILADAVIDATGDADITARAGVPMDKLPENGYLIAMVPGIRVGGIDYRKVTDYVRKHPEDFRMSSADFQFDGENMASIQGLGGWSSLVEEGRKSGEFPVDLQGLGLQIYPAAIKRGIGYFIGSHLSSSIKEGKRYPWNAEHVMQAELDGRNRARKLVEFLKKRVPGFEDCFLIDVSPHVGPQDSRRIIGEYVLTRKDEYEGRTFDDDIALITYTWPDIPIPSEYSGWSMHPLVEEMDANWREGMKSPSFQVIFGVPYRCLIPRGFDGIIVAGQTISMTWMAHEPGPCRGMVPCMHWGQAAGTAAAIAIKQGVSPRQVDIKTLRKTLESQGVNLRKDVIDLSEVTKNLLARGGKISHKA